MFAQVADQADDVARDESSDRAAGIHADHHPAVWVKHEPGRLEVHRVVVDEGTGVAAIAWASALWPTGNRSPRLAIRSWVVASSSTDSAATWTPISARSVQRALECAELGVAVRAPGPAVEQDYAEVAGHVVRQAKSATAGRATVSGGN